jgi:hypothetical protein
MNLALQNSDQLRAVLAHLNIPAQANKADLINQVLLRPGAWSYHQAGDQENIRDRRAVPPWG